MGHSSKKKKKRAGGGAGRRAPSKDNNSFGDDNSELIAEELTALCAIFQDDCTVVSGSPPQIHLKLRPYSKDTGYEESDISALLSVRFLPGYPNKCPKLQIIPEKGLLEVDADNLLSLLHDQANSNAREGRVMIYNLVEAAQEFLSEVVPQAQPHEYVTSQATDRSILLSRKDVAVSSSMIYSSRGPFVYGYIDLFSGSGESWSWSLAMEQSTSLNTSVDSNPLEGFKVRHHNLDNKMEQKVKPVAIQGAKQESALNPALKLVTLEEESEDEIKSTDSSESLAGGSVKSDNIGEKKDILMEYHLAETTDDDRDSGPSESVSSKSLVHNQLPQTIRTDLILAHLLRLACAPKGPLADALLQITSELYDLGIVSERVRDLAIEPSSFFEKAFNHVFNQHMVSSKISQFWRTATDFEGQNSSSMPNSRYLSDFEELQPLGHGGFGHVVLCKNKIDGRQYAIKKIRLKDKSPPINDRILREVATLSRLQHQHVVRYYQAWFETGMTGSFADAIQGSKTTVSSSYMDGSSSDLFGPENKLESTYLYIQMEYCPRTLRQMFESYNQFDKELVWHLFRQIVEGLAHIHGQGIIHRDLTPNNIFFDARNDIKIGDFGLAKFLKLEQVEQDVDTTEAPGVSVDGTGQVGTYFYTAPEIEQGWPKINEKADMYSLGIVFFELWHPFHTAQGPGKVTKQTMAVYLRPMVSSLSSSSYTLFTSFLPFCSTPFPLFSSSIQRNGRKFSPFALYSRSCSSKNGVCKSKRIGVPTISVLATDSSGSSAATVSVEEEEERVYSSEGRVVLPTNETSERLLRIRHTCAHVMAMAVQKLYPDAKVTIGPWIENGFYYDFDMEPLADKDLKRIKKEMDRIIRQNLPLIREEVSQDEARRRILAVSEPYKMEILESIKEEPITIYHIGNEWWDLCAGPHVESTGNISRKAVELESVAGAYWRGDTNKPMLQRIYGTAWENEEQLKAYLHFKEEAKRRDHRRIGQDLDLFSIQDEAGGGLVFWHPKGAIVRHIIEDSWKKIHIECGYDLLYTPHVAKADLWKISGHLDFYKENMYDQMEIEEELYQLRPMNCPYHILVYKRKLHSYRDFPIRVAELGTVYRYELSGSLHGLFRVRGFTQDDAHIFCLEHQIKDEIRGVLDLTEEILLQFGFDKYEVNLSTRPEKAVGNDDIWVKATTALKDALDDKGWSYQIDEGGGAFYGPKIDLKIEDALGRKWQCSTIQVDFNLPQRFDITYIDSDQEKKQPIMIHRAVLGSLERFFGVLIEHYAGDFPLWLSPTQARILPVTDVQLEYCNDVGRKLKANGIRTEICSGERLPKLIRNAEKQKIPLMAVVGPKEAETQTVTVRSRYSGELGTMPIDEFITRIKCAVESRTFI